MLFLPEDPEFAALEATFRWFESVLLAEFGELESDADVPPALNWLQLLPAESRYEIEDAECSLAYVNGAYQATIWDTMGAEELPWAVFLVDAAGVRLLPEYSTLGEDATDEVRDALLERAVAELPDRLLSGAFDRVLPPLSIPDWLQNPVLRELPE